MGPLHRIDFDTFKGSIHVEQERWRYPLAIVVMLISGAPGAITWELSAGRVYYCVNFNLFCGLRELLDLGGAVTGYWKANAIERHHHGHATQRGPAADPFR